MVIKLLKWSNVVSKLNCHKGGYGLQTGMSVVIKILFLFFRKFQMALIVLPIFLFRQLEVRWEEYCGADCRVGGGAIEVRREGGQGNSVRAERERKKKSGHTKPLESMSASTNKTLYYPKVKKSKGFRSYHIGYECLPKQWLHTDYTVHKDRGSFCEARWQKSGSQNRFLPRSPEVLSTWSLVEMTGASSRILGQFVQVGSHWYRSVPA